MGAFSAGQEVTVLGERAVVSEEPPRSGWYLLTFPGRETQKTGWVDGKDLRPVYEPETIPCEELPRLDETHWSEWS